MPKQTQKNRTKSSRTAPRKKVPEESDSTYFLKLVLVVLLGTFWLKFSEPLHVGNFVLAALPLGMIVGLFIVSKFEHFEDDRKIWYAILLVVTIVCSINPAGVLI